MQYEEIIELVDESLQFGKSRILQEYLRQIRDKAIEGKAHEQSKIRSNTTVRESGMSGGADIRLPDVRTSGDGSEEGEE